MPDSGTEITKSASTGDSVAKRTPMAIRVAWIPCPAIKVSGLAKYTYSNRQPFGSAVAQRCERTPLSSIATSSPGSISRTKEAPTISNPALSDATTQPVSNLPSTNGRTPWRSRAAYNVCSSIKTKEKAPSNCGRTAIALASTFFSF